MIQHSALQVMTIAQVTLRNHACTLGVALDEGIEFVAKGDQGFASALAQLVNTWTVAASLNLQLHGEDGDVPSTILVRAKTMLLETLPR